MKATEKIVIASILIMLGALALIPIIYFLNGYFLAIYWQWFISKPFGIRPLSWPEAIGIGIVASWLVSQPIATPQIATPQKADGVKTGLQILERYVLTFIFAWVLHWYI